jgi:hypothetical protein
MQACQHCRSSIDEYRLDKELAPLRDLGVADFNVCADCATVVPDSCVSCGGGVYVPRSVESEPDRCPACRARELARTGRDPGWQCDANAR